MANERKKTTEGQNPPKVARDASGREMEALSYTAVYRQKLKEEHLRPSEVFLMTVDDEGTVDIVRKEKA